MWESTVYTTIRNQNPAKTAILRHFLLLLKGQLWIILRRNLVVSLTLDDASPDKSSLFDLQHKFNLQLWMIYRENGTNLEIF